MLELLQMWALVEILGFVCLPLTITVCHNLPDRGWAFSKAIGMAVLAFCVWLPLMSLHMLPFSQLFIAGVLLILVALNVVGFLRVRSTIVKVLRVNFVYIVATEGVFLGMVFLLGWIRSYGPDIRSYEMFMDEGFLAAIMRSPHFPPNDMWFSGYPINYYYYAHFTIGMLAKLLGQSPSIAFNTGICIFYGLTAVGLFAVTCNIVSWARYTRRTANTHDEVEGMQADRVYPPLLGAIPYGLFTILMGLVIGNLATGQQWWQDHGDLPAYNWFNTTRVIDKTINEFPAFSFLLSCFHAHVLALAFTIVAIGLALNLFLAQSGKGLHVFGRGWQLPLTMGTTALILGGLFAMNGWDFPTYVGLALVCIALQQWLAHNGRFSFELVLDVFIVGAGLTALAFIMYMPFYLNFVSPSQGIGIVGPADRSPLNDEVLIYGTFAFIFLSLLVASALKLPLFTHSTSLANDPTGNTPARQRRWLNAETICLLSLLGADVIISVILPNSATFGVAGNFAVLGGALVLYRLRDRSQAFTLLLGTVAFALVAFCEIVFLKDVFASNYPRMNTVFKFYFQSWALLSITSGAGLFFIVESFRPAASIARMHYWMQRGVEGLWSVGLSLLVAVGLLYPLTSFYPRYAQVNPVTNHEYVQRSNSLDGLNYLQSYSPGDYNAIRWLNSHVSGDPGIVEANGSDYTDYGRVSAFTGLPSPMQWIGHEYQWRVNWLNNGSNAVVFNSRGQDIDTIYTDSQPGVVMSLLARYQIQYVYVGLLEHNKYPKADLHRFSTFMQVVYSADGVTIYKVKQYLSS